MSLAPLAFDREREVKVCAARRIVRGPQVATVVFDDRAAYRQTDANAARLRGEKRIEDLIDRPRRQSNARIADGHRYPSRFPPAATLS